MRGVKKVVLHEPLTNLRKMDRHPGRDATRRRPRSGARSTAPPPYLRAWGKYVIAVNEDIDPDNADALLWAMAYRCNPAHDMQVLQHRDQGHGPHSQLHGGNDAAVLCDATLKEDFPPISLPKREFMERAKAIWEELGLPALKPETPVVRLFARRLVGGVRARRPARGQGRVRRDRQDHRPAPPVGRTDERRHSPHEGRGVGGSGAPPPFRPESSNYRCELRTVITPHPVPLPRERERRSFFLTLSDFPSFGNGRGDALGPLSLGRGTG